MVTIREVDCRADIAEIRGLFEEYARSPDKERQGSPHSRVPRTLVRAVQKHELKLEDPEPTNTRRQTSEYQTICDRLCHHVCHCLRGESGRNLSLQSHRSRVRCVRLGISNSFWHHARPHLAMDAPPGKEAEREIEFQGKQSDASPANNKRHHDARIFGTSAASCGAWRFPAIGVTTGSTHGAQQVSSLYSRKDQG
jgi:hypothetical protein